MMRFLSEVSRIWGFEPAQYRFFPTYAEHRRLAWHVAGLRGSQDRATLARFLLRHHCGEAAVADMFDLPYNPYRAARGGGLRSAWEQPIAVITQERSGCATNKWQRVGIDAWHTRPGTQHADIVVWCTMPIKAHYAVPVCWAFQSVIEASPRGQHSPRRVEDVNYCMLELKQATRAYSPPGLLTFRNFGENSEVRRRAWRMANDEGEADKERDDVRRDGRHYEEH